MHKLITGTTLTGKSTLAKRMAGLYRDAGRKVLVLDELMDKDWPADFITDSPEEFRRIFWNSRNLAVFLDEAGETVGRYDKEQSMTATRGRHWGHICHYIAQRASMIARNVRSQCSEVYAFTCETKDSETLSAEFVQPALLQCPELLQGEYIRAVRFGADRRPFYEKGKVF